MCFANNYLDVSHLCQGHNCYCANHHREQLLKELLGLQCHLLAFSHFWVMRWTIFFTTCSLSDVLPCHGLKIMVPIGYGLKAREQNRPLYKFIISGNCSNNEKLMTGRNPFQDSRVKTVVKDAIIKYWNLQRNGLALHVMLHHDDLHCQGAVGIIPRVKLFSPIDPSSVGQEKGLQLLHYELLWLYLILSELKPWIPLRLDDRYSTSDCKLMGVNYHAPKHAKEHA